MSNTWIWKHARLAWLGLGLLAGLLLAGFWPNTPMRAVATDRVDTFAMATVPLDDSVEAVCFLDFLTGNLGAAVLSKQQYTFNGFYACNVNKDLGVKVNNNPRYMLVSGNADLRRMGGTARSPSKSVIYVAEITSGKVAAYYMPWSQALHVGGAPFQTSFILMDVTKFRSTTGRGPNGGGGGGGGEDK
jgi:hypothetical protein